MIQHQRTLLACAIFTDDITEVPRLHAKPCVLSRSTLSLNATATSRTQAFMFVNLALSDTNCFVVITEASYKRDGWLQTNSAYLFEMTYINLSLTMRYTRVDIQLSSFVRYGHRSMFGVYLDRVQSTARGVRPSRPC